jgi:DNA-directed RNA polymerase specialized sigma24 family protein
LNTSHKKIGLTPEAFESFLNYLDENRERAGEKYEALRQKLLRFFEWRGAVHPDSLADETLDRVSRKIIQGEVIYDIPGYVYGVARFVLRESWEKLQKERSSHDSVDVNTLPAESDVEIDHGDDEIENQRLSQCLDHCLESLPAESRTLILGYYQLERGAKIQNRRELADRLGIPMNALRIRVFRIRERLETCVHECLEKKMQVKWISGKPTHSKEEF